MKTLFNAALVYALINLLGVVAMSAISVVPGSAADRLASVLATLALLAVLFWSGVAVWTRVQHKKGRHFHTARGWVIFGMIQSLLILMLCLG